MKSFSHQQDLFYYILHNYKPNFTFKVENNLDFDLIVNILSMAFNITKTKDTITILNHLNLLKDYNSKMVFDTYHHHYPQSIQYYNELIYIKYGANENGTIKNLAHAIIDMEAMILIQDYNRNYKVDYKHSSALNILFHKRENL